MKKFNQLQFSIFTSFILAACGADPSPSLVNSVQNMQTGSAELQQIATDLAAISSKLKKLRLQRPVNTQSSSSQLTNKPIQTANNASLKSKTTSSKSIEAPIKKAKSATKKPDKLTQGRELLNKIVNPILKSPGFKSEVTQTDISISSGKSKTVTSTILSKQPHQMKIDVTKHTDPLGQGVKVRYNGGTGKMKIKAVGFLILSKTMDDSQVISNNGYKPDQMDLNGLTKRLALPQYQAQVLGKSSFQGQSVHVLKITTTNHTLDTNISHEHLAFDPNSYLPKYWEAYSSQYQTGKKPFMRVNFNQLQLLSQVSDSQMKF